MHIVVGVGAVVVKEGRALIVKRRHEPLKGEWSLPGGRVELGETLVDALRREIKEETGLDVEVGPVLEVFDRIERDAARVTRHYVVIDYLCHCRGGELCAGDDADDVRWVAGDELEAYRLTPLATSVIRKGFQVASTLRR